MKGGKNPLVQVESEVDATQFKKQEASLEALGGKGGETPGADPQGGQGHDPQRPGGRQGSPQADGRELA